MQNPQHSRVRANTAATIGASDVARARPEDELLAARVSRFHLRQRLGIEDAAETRGLRQGRDFLQIENWRFVPSVIGMTLQLAGLRGRGRRNALNIELRHNDIPIDGLPSSFEDFTLLHLSDLHLDMHEDFPLVLIERLRGIDYDVAVITGDFRARTRGPLEPTVDALRALRPHLRGAVYAVLGNHDSLRMVPHFESMDVRMLLNESVAIERDGESIHLAGVDDPHHFRSDNMEKAATGIPPEAVSVLLAHSPEIYKQAAHAGFSLMLCGHTHGGQICLPGGFPLMVNARCARRYCKGAWNYHALAGYTSAGSGVSMVEARLNCPPEITLHRLRMA